jgi:lipase ATG15
LNRRLDVPDYVQPRLWTEDGQEIRQPLRASSRPLRIQQLSGHTSAEITALVENNRRRGSVQAIDISAWKEKKVHGPDTTSKQTIITLAEMCHDAYYPNSTDVGWHDVGSGFNDTDHFGWDADGLRGHIFSNKDSSIIVMAIKGTSVAWVDRGETTTNDKVNDNLFFGCCCGGQSMFTLKVCNCQKSTYTCSSTCLTRELLTEDRYYAAAVDIFLNVTAQYPKAQIWLTGHSLGGSISSLLAHTYTKPAVTFEAPPEALAITRLGIPAPPGKDPLKPHLWATPYVHHFGNTADPIFMGVCNGISSSCNLIGYALESSCHGGLLCVYDTVKDHNRSLRVDKHRIRFLIDEVILAYNETAPCGIDPECIDCSAWKFVKGGSDRVSSTSITSATSSTTTTPVKTRTTKCETPGWFSCLDKSTTTTTKTLEATSTKIIIITTTLTTTSVKVTTTTTTSTCKDPGWFGCRDTPKTIFTTTRTTTSEATNTSNPQLSTSCHTPGYFWGCRDGSHGPTSTNVKSLL